MRCCGVWFGRAEAAGLVGAGFSGILGRAVGWIERSGAQRLWEGGESGERGGQLVSPGPVFGDAHEQAALAAGDAGGDVQQPVAQRLRLAPGELAVEQGGLGPGDQVGCGEGEFEPPGVDGEQPGRESAQAGVFAAADAVLDGGVPTMPGV